MKSSPIVLLEGTRNVSPPRRKKLHEFAAQLAKDQPKATFRSGGALGSDEAFSLGVSSVSDTSLQLVLPEVAYRKTKLTFPSQKFGLDQITQQELEILVDAATASSPKHRHSFKRYPDLPPRPKIAIALLLRDALKVIGAPSLNLAPASFAYFNLNPDNPHSGGTQHTISICEACDVDYQILD